MARTNPIGVRFDPEKLDFIKGREKLKSNQQVVDLLINKYWWEHKLPIPTAKEAPPLDLKTKEAYEKPVAEMVANRPKSPAQWVQEKQELLSPEAYQEFLQRLEADPYLSDRQKNQIKQS